MLTMNTFRNANAASVYPFLNQDVSFDLSLIRYINICVPSSIGNKLISRNLKLYVSQYDTNKLTLTITADIEQNGVQQQLLLGSFIYYDQLAVSLISNIHAQGLLYLNHAPTAFPSYTKQAIKLDTSCLIISPAIGNVKEIKLNEQTKWFPEYPSQPSYRSQIWYPQDHDTNTLKIRSVGVIASKVSSNEFKFIRNAGTGSRLNSNNTLTVPAHIQSILGVPCTKLQIKAETNHPVQFASKIMDDIVTVYINSGTSFPGCSS